MKSEDLPELLLAENKLTVAKALQATTVRNVQKQIGEKDLLKVVSFMLRACISNFNVTTKPTEQQATMQIYTMANDLINKYPLETLEDFALCFKKARNFEFGATYNRIDSETIFGWMSKYLEETAAEREIQHYNLKHPKQSKEEVKPIEFKDPENKKHYDAVAQIAKDLKRGVFRSVKDIFPKAELPTHEAFIENIKKTVKKMSEQELVEYLKQAASGKLYDVIEIINAEKERRKL